MSHIFRELEEIPVPDFALVCSNGRVLVVTSRDDGKREQLVIGLATSKTTMHPNTAFKFAFPDLWKKYYGEKKLKAGIVSTGLYGLFLSVAYKSALYQRLQEYFGTFKTNIILDYAMFCTHERTVSTYLMSDFTRDQLIFSEKKYGDSFYSDFFNNEIDSDAIHHFKIDMLNNYQKNSCKSVWLCIDGSNNDCNVQNSKIAENGNSKSHNAVKIYSYIWAVTSNGSPVTYILNNGSKVDSKAFEEIQRLLASSNIQVEGVILDRGFATEDCLKLIRESGYKYVVMLPSNSFAYKSMFEQYAHEIFWNFDYAINRKGMFGITQRGKVFASGEEEACIGFYFNPRIASPKSLDFIMDVFDARDDISAQIAQGKEIDEIVVPTELKRYLSIYTDDKGEVQVTFDNKLCKRSISTKGYSTIASSENFSAEQISAIYDLRDASEKQFSILKSQLGASVTRVHSDRSIEAKFFTLFVSAIIRSEIEFACKELKLDTNKMIKEADRTHVSLMSNDKYHAIHDQSKRMKELFAYFGLNNDHLDFFADEINRRTEDIVHSQVRSLSPLSQGEKRGRGLPKNEKTQEEENKPKRGPGRPKGSKNKKTIEREKLAAQQPPQEKRKRGRPKGSKNKKTLAREAKLNAPKRGRGRPKGSKNKKTLEREAQQKKSKKTRNDSTKTATKVATRTTNTVETIGADEATTIICQTHQPAIAQTPSNNTSKKNVVKEVKRDENIPPD